MIHSGLLSWNHDGYAYSLWFSEAVTQAELEDILEEGKTDHFSHPFRPLIFKNQFPSCVFYISGTTPHSLSR